MQASRFECLSFDPFALFQNGFVTAKVDVGRCDVVDALVLALDYPLLRKEQLMLTALYPLQTVFFS